MATRNLNRKHGNRAGSGLSSDAPFLIKVGFDGREIMTPAQLDSKTKSGKRAGDFKKPSKLMGFLIRRNNVRAKGFGHEIAYDQMEALGYDAEKIKQAMRLQHEAEAGKFLPAMLHIAIPHDAVRAGDHWEYPGVYSEEFEYHNVGRKCHGDGHTAHRRQGDGTTKQMDCKPVGSCGRKDSECCPLSVKGDCKSKARFIFKVWNGDPENEQPLSKEFAWTAKYRLDTTSEYAQLNILTELDRAADATGGRIGGLVGHIYFSLQEKRYIDNRGESRVGKVGQVRLSLDDPQIERRASGESDRIAEQAYKDLPPQPERTEHNEREHVQEPANTPAPEQPETNTTPREADSSSVSPDAIDLGAMTDQQIVGMLRDFIGWSASRTGSSAEAIADELVWFTERGKDYRFSYLDEAMRATGGNGWDWFGDGADDEKQAKRTAKLREIAERIVTEEDFAEWQNAEVGL